MSLYDLPPIGIPGQFGTIEDVKLAATVIGHTTTSEGWPRLTLSVISTEGGAPYTEYSVNPKHFKPLVFTRP